MSLTHNHLPVPAAYRQRLSITEPLEIVRQRCRELTKAAEALAIVIQLLGGEASTMIKVNGRWRRLLAGIAHNQAARQKLRLRHVQIAVKALTEPAR